MTPTFRVWILAVLVTTGCSSQTGSPDTSKTSLPTVDFRARMKQFGVKQAGVELHFTWFLGPNSPKPTRTIYFTDDRLYVQASQLTDPKILEEIKDSGLETALTAEAIAHVKGGSWFEPPSLLPSPAAAMVTVFDDASRVSKPGMYWHDDTSRTPLQQAIFSNDVADVLRLLASGKISSQELDDGLFWACGPAKPEILKALLHSGANVNTISDKGNEHITPLMVAVRWRNGEALETLVKSGGKANARDEYGETELTTLLNDSHDQTLMVSTLLESGVDVNAVNIYGLTALMRASSHQPAPVLELLIKHGANVNAKDRRGRTALNIATEDGNDVAAKVLLAAGARP